MTFNPILVPAVLTTALPALHRSQLSKASSFTPTGSNPWHHWFALSSPRSPFGGTWTLCLQLPLVQNMQGECMKKWVILQDCFFSPYVTHKWYGLDFSCRERGQMEGNGGRAGFEP